MDSNILDEPVPSEDYLAHYGVLGMKWGIRRYQPYPKGDGPKGRFIGEKAKSVVTSAGRGTVRTAKAVKTGVVKAKNAYDAKAPERAAKKAHKAEVRAEKDAERKENKAQKTAERAEKAAKKHAEDLERRAADNIKNDVLRDPKKVSKMSAEELAATYDRLNRTNEAKKLSEAVNHPNAELRRKLTERVLNRVADKAVDEAFDFVKSKTYGAKSPLEKAVTTAELNAKLANANANIQGANARQVRARQEYDKLVGNPVANQQTSATSQQSGPSQQKQSSGPAKAVSGSNLEVGESKERRAQLEEIQRHRQSNREIGEKAMASREAREARRAARENEATKRQLAEIQKHREQNEAIGNRISEETIRKNRDQVTSVADMSRYTRSGVSFASGHRNSRSY